MNRELLEKYELSHLADLLQRFEKQAIAFQLSPPNARSVGRSRLGGLPLLPPQYDWPRSKKRPLDFLLQIDLADTQIHDQLSALPTSGLLTFFYDFDNQPWGFDPNELDGFRVDLILSNSLIPTELPSSEFALPEHAITFNSAITLPHRGSRAYDLLEREAQLTSQESDNYLEFLDVFEKQFHSSEPVALHRLLGHSANVQDDMQLEAQLVTNGLYCGNQSGYTDPRANELENGADDWLLLLQLDSDQNADLMWGDAGMLYYWIRSEDLVSRRFNRTWMGLQCY